MKKSKKLLMTLSLFSLVSTLSGCKKDANSSNITTNVSTSNSQQQSSSQPDEDNIFKYYVNSDNKITISGLNKEVENVIVPSTIDEVEVTEIGDGFRNFNFVKTVSLPKTITNIDSAAFYNCPLLENIEIDSENEIYYKVNNCILSGRVEGNIYCYKAWGERIELPEEVNIVYLGAFCDIKTKEIKFGKNVSTIFGVAFSYYNTMTSNIEKIEVDSANANFKVSGNCLYQISDNSVIYGYGDCVLPDNIVRFYDTSFKWSNLTSVYLSKSLNNKNFKEDTFANCEKLTSIKVDSNNSLFTSAVNGVERNCVMSKDGTILYSAINNSDIADTITTIDSYAYSSKYLVNYVIKKNITKINGNPFLSAYSLNSLTVSSDSTSFDLKNNCLLSKDDTVIYSVFSNEFTLPSTLKKIADSCFSNTDITSIDLPSSITEIGANAFAYSALNSIVIPDSVTTIGKGCFLGCSNLSDVKFSSSLTVIPQDCFRVCNKLIKVTIPDNITRIENYAFYMSKNIKQIEISNNSKLEYIGNYAFRDAKITEIFVPKNLTYLDCGAFDGCLINKIVVDPANLYFTSQDDSGNEINKLMSKNRTKLYALVDNDLEIPSSITHIMPDSLQYQRTPKKIDLSKTNITTMGAADSHWYNSYTQIVSYDSSIREMILPEKCTTINKYSLCNLKIVTMYNKVNYINSDAFSSYLIDLTYNGTKEQFKTLVTTKSQLTSVLGSSSKLSAIKFLEAEDSASYISVDIDSIY